MIKGVVFDLDHTLYDRDASDRVAFGHYYDEFPDRFLPGVTREQAQEAVVSASHRHIHTGWKAVTDCLAREGILRPLGDLDEFVEFMMEQYHICPVPFPFIEALFARLRSMGLKVALITNGLRRHQENKLRGLHMENMFDEILIGCDPATAKPHTDLFTEMAQKLDCAPDELIYAGDNPVNDVDASRRAGYHAVWVRTMPPWNHPELPLPRWQVDTVNELPALVGQINASIAASLKE